MHGLPPFCIDSAFAGFAKAAKLDHRPARAEAASSGKIANTAGCLIVIDVSRLATLIANHEDAVMLAARVGVSEKRVGAFNSQCKVVRHEQI